MLLALGACGLAPAISACGRTTGAARASTTTTARASAATADRLARRLTFAPTTADLELAHSGTDAFLDAHFDPARTDGAAAATVRTGANQLRLLLAAGGRPVAEPQRAAQRRLATGAVLLDTVGGAAWSDRQLHALLSDFWADHLHVALNGQPESWWVVAYDHDVVRPHALGRFDELLAASARSAAMLLYLDQATSRADAGFVPNENYARELLELHTVGRDGGYDEDDVLSAAHVLSGWSTVPTDGTFVFRARRHDLGPAVGDDILGFRATDSGVADGDGLLHHLAHLPATARYVCWRLALRLVGDHVEPDDQVVTAAAGEFRANGTSVEAAVRSLVGSPEFADAPDVSRRPLDLVAAYLRTGAAPPRQEQLEPLAERLYATLQGLGQTPYGWPSPDGYPLRGAPWTTPGGLVARWNAAVAGATGFGVLAAAPGTGADSSPADTAATLLGADPEPALRQALAQLGRDPDPVAVRAVVMASPQFGVR